MAAASVLLAACGKDLGSEVAPARTAPEGARFWFRDVTEAAGLAAFRQVNGGPSKPHIVDQMGAGVAFLDHDGDGDLDVYLTNGSRLEGFPPGEEPADALFENVGGSRFEDRTAEAGLGDTSWTNGVTVADVDGDGSPDVYLTNFGANVLYLNRGGRFEDVTESAGVGDPSWSTGAAFFDADLDGDLDLYVANYVDFDPDFVPEDPQACTYRGIMVAYGPRGLPEAPDRFFRNDGDGSFSDRTEEAGMAGEAGYGFQVVVFDHEEDGDTDVFVGNDSVDNFLWRNDGTGRFTNDALRSGSAVSQVGEPQACMGASVGDYNGDGRFDLFVTNFAGDYHTLYRGDRGGFFSDVTVGMGLRSATLASLGWSCGFVDFDSDGDEDLFAVNGHVYPQVDRFDFGTSYRQRVQLFENDGGELSEATDRAGPGLEPARVGRGGAWGDYDGDGDVDLLIGNLDDRPTLLRNDAVPSGKWLGVRLVGTVSNRDGIGATVTLTAGGRVQKRAAGSNSGFCSSGDPRLHFGLGPSDRADAVDVRWPGGPVERFGPLDAGRTHELVEGSGRLLAAGRTH